MKMTKEERVAIATASFSNGYNCAQSVISAWPELMPGCRESVMKQASGFGAGMGRLQEVCGALTGAYMVIGLSNGSHKPDDIRKEFVYGAIQELTRKFVVLNREVTCKKLIKVDLNTEHGREMHRSVDIREKVCEKCVSDSVALLFDILHP